MTPAMPVIDAEDKAFLALLRCPLCARRPPLRREPDTDTFLCESGLHRFPRIDGFPALRPGDAVSADAAG